VLDGAQAPKLTGRDRLTSHHRPGETPGGGAAGGDGGAQVKGMVEHSDDDDDGDGGGGGGRSGSGEHLNDAAAHGTVHLALSVLHAHLKKGCLSPHALGVGEAGNGGGASGSHAFAQASPAVLRDVLAMAEPFLPLLNGCARAAVADDRVRLLALKCLGLLLKWPLAGMAKYARRLGKGLLKLLAWAASSSSSSATGLAASRSELVQGCLKGLATLLYFDPSEALAAGGGALGLRLDDDGGGGNFAVTAELAAAATAQHCSEVALKDGDGAAGAAAVTVAAPTVGAARRGPLVALSAVQMKALVRVLHGCVLDASHQTSSFLLVRALVHQRVVVSEM
jgi:hypothetical protein